MTDAAYLVWRMRANIADAKRRGGRVLDQLDATDGVLAAGLPYWEGLDDRVSGQISPVVASGIAVLRGLADQAASLSAETGMLEQYASDMLSATGTYAALVSSVSGSGFHVPGFDPQVVTEQSDRYTDRRTYAERLRSFDPELGGVYEEIWQVLARTDSAPERAALAMMRQAFDHLVDKLAPVDRVRAEPGWVPEDPDKPDQVTRRQRLEYIADHVLEGDAKRRLMHARINHVSEVYQSLNKLHSRQALDAEAAVAALRSMADFLERLVDDLAI
jgi:hypothetical protein